MEIVEDDQEPNEEVKKQKYRPEADSSDQPPSKKVKMSASSNDVQIIDLS